MKEKSWEKEATRSWLWGAQVESEHSEGGSRGSEFKAILSYIASSRPVVRNGLKKTKI